MIPAMWWYIQEYGEDWAEIVREEDMRKQNQNNMIESWSRHPINQQ